MFFDGKCIIECFRVIELSRHHYPWISHFFLLLDSFPHLRSGWKWDFVKRVGRICLLNVDDRFSKSRKEKPLIRWSIGSFRSLSRFRLCVFLLILFRSLSRVRLCVFFLIFHPISLDCNLESYIRLVLDFILNFSLFVIYFLCKFYSLIFPRILIQIVWFFILWIFLWVLFPNLSKFLISHLNSLSDFIEFQRIPQKYFNYLWIWPLFTSILLD